jgi:hypothetical protein
MAGGVTERDDETSERRRTRSSRSPPQQFAGRQGQARASTTSASPLPPPLTARAAPDEEDGVPAAVSPPAVRRHGAHGHVQAQFDCKQAVPAHKEEHRSVLPSRALMDGTRIDTDPP